jgi:putative alpha-1,2-mannosidase
MSAWLLFSSLGFYPVAPASDRYELGSPSIKSAILKLENGKILTIEANNQSDKNVYVEKISLNGKLVNRNYVTHTEIMNGGKPTFTMSDKPKV